MLNNIQIIAAPSILGLKSHGVDKLAGSLLSNGLLQKLNSPYPPIEIPTLNRDYNHQRDPYTHVRNGEKIATFSLSLNTPLKEVLNNGRFPLVLGGDCSILIGVMASLKKRGNFGLLFMDAHADFYEPEKSTTGEVADMDLAIVTGRGPHILTNLYNARPYVKDEHVIHIAQRDWEETVKYGAQDIKASGINCLDLQMIRSKGVAETLKSIHQTLAPLEVDGSWIHFDTDVLSDDINPAVDYRLPGGLSFDECIAIIKSLRETGRITGMTVTIFNPDLDSKGSIAKNITTCLAKALT